MANNKNKIHSLSSSNNSSATEDVFHDSECIHTSSGSTINQRKRRRDTVSIEMTKERLQAACVELTTTNGRSFTLMEDSGMRMILSPIISALQATDPTFAVNRKNVRDWVVIEAAKVRETIRKEIKGKLICLKLDMATRLDRSVLGINIQYCKENRIILRCLCVKQIFKRHTATNLQDELFDVLNSYGITSEQIYTITTDNGSNLVKMLQLVNENNNFEINLPPIFEVEDSSDEEYEDEDMRQTSEEAEEDKLERGHEEIFSWPKPLNNFITNMGGQGIIGLRCAAHTLQLAVLDAIRSSTTIQNLLSKVRDICKLLRTPIASEYLRALGYNKPVIDNDTRWLSTLTMIQSLLPLKSVFLEAVKHCKKNIYILEAEWDQIQNISDALLPLQIATKKLQTEQLTVGDFFATWLRCKLDCKGSTNTFAQEIAAAMDRRENILLASDSIVSALYLNPRYQVILGKDEMQRARLHLIALWNRLKNFKNSYNETSCSDSEQESVTSVDINDVDPVEKLLRLKEAQQKKATKTSAQNKQSSLEKILRNFEGVTRLKASENILQYWQVKENAQPELYELAMTVLASPMTQVSVERAFSSLKFVLNVLRSKLDANLTNDILVVRCNKLFMRNETDSGK